MSFDVIVSNKSVDEKDRNKFHCVLNRPLELNCDYLVGVSGIHRYFANQLGEHISMDDYEKNLHVSGAGDVGVVAKTYPETVATTFIEHKDYPHVVSAAHLAYLKAAYENYIKITGIQMTHLFNNFAEDCAIKIKIQRRPFPNHILITENSFKMPLDKVEALYEVNLGLYALKISNPATTFDVVLVNYQTSPKHDVKLNEGIVSADNDIYLDSVFKAEGKKSVNEDEIVLEFSEAFKTQFKLDNRIIAYKFPLTFNKMTFQLRKVALAAKDWPDIRTTLPNVFMIQVQGIDNPDSWNTAALNKTHPPELLYFQPTQKASTISIPGVRFIRGGFKPSTIVGTSRKMYYLFNNDLHIKMNFKSTAYFGCKFQQIECHWPNGKFTHLDIHASTSVTDIPNQFNGLVESLISGTGYKLGFSEINYDIFPSMTFTYPKNNFKIALPHILQHYDITTKSADTLWQFSLYYSNAHNTLVSRELTLPHEESANKMLTEFKKIVQQTIDSLVPNVEPKFEITTLLDDTVTKITIPRNFRIHTTLMLAKMLGVPENIEFNHDYAPFWIISNIVKESYVNNRLIGILNPMPFTPKDNARMPKNIQYVPVKCKNISAIDIEFVSNLNPPTASHSTLVTDLHLHFIPDPYKHLVLQSNKLKRKL